MKELPSSFPRESKEFRRGPDLPRRGESREQESSTNPWSKIEIAARSFFGEKKGCGGGKRKRGLGHPAVGLYILKLSGPDDPR